MLSHQLGKLGRDGQRVLRLSWQVQWHLWGLPGCSLPFHPPSHPLFLPSLSSRSKGMSPTSWTSTCWRVAVQGQTRRTRWCWAGR